MNKSSACFTFFIYFCCYVTMFIILMNYILFIYLANMVATNLVIVYMITTKLIVRN